MQAKLKERLAKLGAQVTMQPMEFMWKTAMNELHSVVARFFEGFDTGSETKQKQSLFASNKKLTNLKLKPDAFHSLSLPLYIEEGTIREISTDIDISDLFKETSGPRRRFMFRVRGVRLKVRPSIKGLPGLVTFRENFKSLKLVLEELINNYFMQADARGYGFMISHTDVRIEDIEFVFYDSFNEYGFKFKVDSIETRTNPNKKKTSSGDAMVTTVGFTNLSIDHVAGKVQKRTEALEPLSGAIVVLTQYIATAAEADKIAKHKKKDKQRGGMVVPHDGAEGSVSSSTDGQSTSGWGLTFILSLESHLRVNLTPETLTHLAQFVHHVTDRLFDENRDQTGASQLQQLRWYPVSGHAHEYWKFCLRTCFPHIVHKVAKAQGIEINEAWANVYGVMQPIENKERYILLYQRSLNLVGSEPLSNLEEAEKSYLESQHATDTIILWRTEGKIRLKLERPDPTSRVSRRQFHELKHGVLEAVLSVFQEVIPPIHLTKNQKRECFTEALRFCKPAMLYRKFEGVNFSVVAAKLQPSVKLKLVGDPKMNVPHAVIAIDEMNIEVDTTHERTLVQVIANQFWEMGDERTIFGQDRHGILHFYTRFPHSGVRGSDARLFSSLFMQHVDVLHGRDLVQRLYKLIVEPLRASRGGVTAAAKADAKAAEDNEQQLREVMLDLTLSDSRVSFPTNPLHGSVDQFTFDFGQPEWRPAITEDTTVPNLALKITMKPRQNTMKATVLMHDVRAWWRSQSATGGKANRMSRRRHRQAEQREAMLHQPFDEPFIHRLGTLAFEASINEFDVQDEVMEEFMSKFSIDHTQMRVSQKLLGQFLKLMAMRVKPTTAPSSNSSSTAAGDDKNDEFLSHFRPPFSHRTVIGSLEMLGDASSLTNDELEHAFVLAAKGIDMETLEIQEAEDEVDNHSTLRSLLQRFSRKVFDHVVDGLLATNKSIGSTVGVQAPDATATAPAAGAHPSNPAAATASLGIAAEAAEATFGVSSFALARKRVLAAEPWTEEMIENINFQLDQLLVWDIARLDGSRYNGATLHNLECVLPQGIFDGAVSIERNAEYMALHVKDAVYVRDTPEEDFLVPHEKFFTLARSMRPSRLDDELTEGIRLLGDRIVSYPDVERCKFRVHVRKLDVTYAVRKKVFCRVHLAGLLAAIAAHAPEHTEPTIELTYLDMAYDCRMLEGLLGLRSPHGFPRLVQEHAVRLQRQGDWEPVLFEAHLSVEELKWVYRHMRNTDKDFHLRTMWTARLPYSAFSDIEQEVKSQFGLMMQGNIDAHVTRRRTAKHLARLSTHVDEHDEEDDLKLKRDTDYEERYFAKANVQQVQVAHTAHPKWRAPIRHIVELDEEPEEVAVEENTLPGLPVFYPVENTTIRDREGAAVARIVSQLLFPVDMQVNVTMQDSNLHPHTTAEERDSVRKLPEYHLEVAIETQQPLEMNVTARDMYFLMTSIFYSHHKDRSVSTDFSFKLRFLPELNISFKSRDAKIRLLDEQSNQSSKNPVLEFNTTDFTADFSYYSSRATVRLGALAKIDYAVLPERQAGDVTIPQADAAELRTLCDPFGFDVTLNQDTLADGRGTSMLTGQIFFARDLHLRVTVPFLSQTLPRLSVLTDMVPAAWQIAAAKSDGALSDDDEHAADGGNDFMKRPLDETLTEAKTRTTWVRNLTGVTLLMRRLNDASEAPALLANDTELEVDISARPLPEDYVQEESDFAIELAVDGGWTPKLRAELLPDFKSVQFSRSRLGPSFLRLKDKEIKFMMLTRVEEKATSTKLTLDIHSNVKVINRTQDPLLLSDGTRIEPGVEKWLPIMVASTDTLTMRPSIEYSPSGKINYDLTSADSKVEVTRDKAGDLHSYQNVEASHISAKGGYWGYSCKITQYDESQVVEVVVRAPIQITNHLPFPIILSVRRPVKQRNVKFYIAKDGDDKKNHNSESDEDSDEQPKQRFFIERGTLAGSGHWNVHGGLAFDAGRLSIAVQDSPTGRADGLYCTKRLPLENPRELEKGFVLGDGSTNRHLRVFLVDCVTSKAENQHFRHLRVFSHYVFVDRTGLQLRFSEDHYSYMTSHYQHPDSAAIVEGRVAFSTIADRDSERHVQLSTPYCQRYSPHVRIPAYMSKRIRREEHVDLTEKAIEQEVDAELAQPGEFHVVRVPTTMHFATEDERHRGAPHPDLADAFCSEVVLTVEKPLGNVGPTQVICRPRLRIVNHLSCAAVVRQRAPAPDMKERELPIFVPSGRSSAFQFYDKRQEDVEHVEPLQLDFLRFMLLFVDAEVVDPAVGQWEWSEPVPINRPGVHVMSVHNSNLDRRMIIKVEVVVEGPHHIVFLNNYEISDLKYKVQNQTSQYSVRFSQQSRYWQTLHPGSTTVPYAWDQPSALPRLLKLNIFSGTELISLDVDLEPARLGMRQRIRMPGARPDIMVQTRLEASTGATVLVVSNYVADRSLSLLSTYEAEEKRFMMSLLKHSKGHFHALHRVETSKMFVPVAQAPTRLQPEYSHLTIQIVALRGVEFSEQSLSLAVVSFGKLTRKVTQLFQPTVFHFNKHHDPTDSDFDTLYVDLYERHTHEGTRMLRSATVREVRWLTQQREVATVEIALHRLDHQRVLLTEEEAVPKTQPIETIVLRLSVAHRTHTGVSSVPGVQLAHLTMRSPHVTVSLENFARLEVNNMRLMHVVSQLKSLWDVTFEDLTGYGADKERILLHEGKMSAALMTRNRDLDALDFVYHYRLHPDVVSALDTTRKVSVVDKVFVDSHDTPLYSKIEEDTLFQLVNLLTRAGLLAEEDGVHEKDASSIYVHDLEVTPTTVNVSCQTADPVNIMAQMMDTVQDRPKNLVRWAAAHAGSSDKPDNDDADSEVTALSDPVRQPVNLEKHTETGIVHAAARTSDSVATDTLRWTAARLIEQAKGQTKRLEALHGFEVFASDALVRLQQAVEKARHPPGEEDA